MSCRGQLRTIDKESSNMVVKIEFKMLTKTTNSEKRLSVLTQSIHTVSIV